MKHYSEITVYISPAGPDGRYPVRVSSEEGGQGHATMRLPFRLADLAGVVFGAASTERATGSLKAAPAAAAAPTRSVADFGTLLFDALFQDEARTVFDKTDSVAQAGLDRGVRIRLSMDLRAPGMAEVAALPWELMCRRGQRPLVVSKQTPLVRSLDVAGPMDPRPFVAPLRILVLMANPRGSAMLNLQRERELIEQSWARLPGVAVDFVRPVKAEVLRQLALVDYHVVHYMGHGDFEAEEGGLLLLELEDGSPDPVTGDEFAMWLADEPLRLVFLNACKTGTTPARSGAHPFAGVATALIRDRVPAVVAMQFPISDQAAIVFAQTFYERIAQGLPVEAAVAEGRKLLYSGRDTEWATPVLYLRARDGRLFSLPEAAAGNAAPAMPLAAAQPQPAATEPLRVYLACTDQDREKLHGQLTQALRGIERVQLLDAAALDESVHAAQAEALLREADLCVHLLGASPGRRIDVDDEQPLRTYPLVELDIAGRVARAQLVLMTAEDRESIASRAYAGRIEALATVPRDKQRFEMVVAGRAQVTQALLDKVQALKAAREMALGAGAPGGRRKALVDAHLNDQERALDLVSFFEERDIDTTMNARSTADLAGLDHAVKQTDLYVIVAGAVDRSWVSNRKVAIMKAAVKSRAALLVARYAAGAEAGDAAATVTGAQMEISALNDSDRSWVDALFSPGAGGRA